MRVSPSSTGYCFKITTDRTCPIGLSLANREDYCSGARRLRLGAVRRPPPPPWTLSAYRRGSKPMSCCRARIRSRLRRRQRRRSRWLPRWHRSPPPQQLRRHQLPRMSMMVVGCCPVPMGRWCMNAVPPRRPVRPRRTYRRSHRRRHRPCPPNLPCLHPVRSNRRCPPASHLPRDPRRLRAFHLPTYRRCHRPCPRRILPPKCRKKWNPRWRPYY